jgi:hypothetical protein
MKSRSLFSSRRALEWIAVAALLFVAAGALASVLQVPKDQFDHYTEGKSIFRAAGWLEDGDPEKGTLFVHRTYAPDLTFQTYRKTRYYEYDKLVTNFVARRHSRVEVYYWMNPADQRIADQVYAW